jgi:cytochrome c oxidase subunit 2
MSPRIWQSVFDPAGPQARHIEGLSWFLIWTTTAVMLAVLGLFTWAIYRGMRRARRAEPEGTLDRTLTRMIVTALSLTVVVLCVILVESQQTGRAIAALATPNPIAITVNGHQFWWEVRYETDPPADRVVTANELIIPVGRAVVLRLESSDVVHSFWVPMLHGKRDLIPGRRSELWIQADRPGVFQGQCAEFCGRQHAHMAFTVTALEPTAFDQWLDHQRQPAPPPSEAAPARGQRIFLEGRCSACHTVSGTSARGQVGPDLTHIGSRPTIGAGTLPNSPQRLARWIEDPHRDKAGVRMPSTPLPAPDLADLVAYLGSLR